MLPKQHYKFHHIIYVDMTVRAVIHARAAYSFPTRILKLYLGTKRDIYGEGHRRGKRVIANKYLTYPEILEAMNYLMSYKSKDSQRSVVKDVSFVFKMEYGNATRRVMGADSFILGLLGISCFHLKWKSDKTFQNDV